MGDPSRVEGSGSASSLFGVVILVVCLMTFLQVSARKGLPTDATSKATAQSVSLDMTLEMLWS